MSEAEKVNVLKLIDSGCKVRAWIKSMGLVLRVRKGNQESWVLIRNNKIVANC